MAIITIVRGQTRLLVPGSMFDSYYKKIGFRKASDMVNNGSEWNENEKQESVNEDNNKSVNVDTVPISEMSSAQLREYAAKHNIDISSARKPSDARRIIQKHIQGEKM